MRVKIRFKVHNQQQQLNRMQKINMMSTMEQLKIKQLIILQVCNIEEKNAAED
ncbi:hypothetical protein ACVQ92_13060 [Staphylococcus aureus]